MDYNMYEHLVKERNITRDMNQRDSDEVFLNIIRELSEIAKSNEARIADLEHKLATSDLHLLKKLTKVIPVQELSEFYAELEGWGEVS